MPTFPYIQRIHRIGSTVAPAFPTAEPINPSTISKDDSHNSYQDSTKSVIISFMALIIPLAIVLVALVTLISRKWKILTEKEVKYPAAENLWNLKKIKLLLLGPTGSGKSSTGNTILDQSCFKFGMSSSGVTQQCTKETADRFNRRIEVVDTPGFSNITGTTRKTAWKLLDNPDAVLLVLDLSRFTSDIKRNVKEIIANLDEDIFKIMFIVFTMKDELHRHGMSIEDYVNTFPVEMLKLQQKCNNRIKCINNVKHGSENTTFVKQLVEDIEILWATNADKCTI